MKRKHMGRLVLLTLFTIFYTAIYAQSGSITGQVLDEANQPVSFASVTIKGNSRGTSADENGRFKLNALANGSYTIVVNAVGFSAVSKTIQVNGGDVNTSFSVKKSVADLTEAVVIGYGTAKKKDLTGAITAVGVKDFQKGTITSPDQLIQGKVPGVSITSNSGQPGAGSKIRIRGGASLNASNNPLIVIDGVPVANLSKPDGTDGLSGVTDPLSLVNPSDIETMTVLKDAASTAIYGSRASNGVIMITTKKGKSGKAKVNFNTQFGVAKVARKVHVLAAHDFRTLVDSIDNAGTYTPYLGKASTDWQNEIYQTGISSDNNLSLSGTFKKMPYRFSVGYLNSKGILRTDQLQRTSAGINLNPRFFDDHLRVDINLKGAVNNTRFANQDAINAAVTMDPTQPVYAPSPYGGYYEWQKANGTAGDSILNIQATRNPVALLNQKNDKGEVDRSYGNVQLDYKFHFLPELRANLNLGYDVAKGFGNVFVPANAAQNYVDSGKITKYLQKINNKVLEFYFNYNKDLKGAQSNINATVGYGYYDNLSTNYNYPQLRANGDTNYSVSVSPFPYDKPRNTLVSYYGRLIYTFKDKYILSGSLRTDGSSRFAKDVRWGWFPSLAFAWKMKEENFLKTADALSNLNLRLSYGVTGQQDGIANYSYLAVYSKSTNTAQYQFGDSLYYMYRPQAYDANLKWEQTATYNAGIDYGFLNNRINGSIDFYVKKTSNLISTVPIAVGSNFANTLLTNVGNMDNKGVEFSINYSPIRTQKLTWDINFNATYNSNKITKLLLVNDPGFQGIAVGDISGATGYKIQQQQIGYTTNAFFLFKQVYDKAGKPIEGAYVDLNKDGIINPSDRYYYKSPFPKVILGFSTQVTYGKWSLSTVLRANFGNYMYNNLASNLDRVYNVLNPLNYLQNATVDIKNTYFSYAQLQSDYYVQNASFLKMDNLGLTYNFGRIIDNKMGLILNANCQNVFTVTKYTGVDPEIYGGIDNKFYPRSRIYTLGLNLNF